MTSPLTPSGRGLGLIPDAPDDRDRLFVAAPEATPYKFVDLEKDSATPPVWNQLQLGSCTAHGTLACFLWASAKCGANDPMLSRLQLYFNTRKIEGTTDSDSGGQIRDAIKASAMGIAPEIDWPYDIAKFTEAPPAAAVADARDNVDLAYERVNTTQGAIQACLSGDHPIDIGVTLYRSFESSEALATGFVGMPTHADGSPIGGHCMAIWGIGTGEDWHADGQFAEAKLMSSKLYVKVRNSWGDQVYQRGYLLMPLDYVVDPDLGQDYWMIKSVS